MISSIWCSPLSLPVWRPPERCWRSSGGVRDGRTCGGSVCCVALFWLLLSALCTMLLWWVPAGRSSKGIIRTTGKTTAMPFSPMVSPYLSEWKKLPHSSFRTTAIAGMCVALCLVAAGLAIYDVVARKMGRLGDQQLVVASASFTRDGKILVKPDGSIPMQTMSTRASMREIMRELHISSSTFQWLYQLTWNWGVFPVLQLSHPVETLS